MLQYMVTAPGLGHGDVAITIVAEAVGAVRFVWAENSPASLNYLSRPVVDSNVLSRFPGFRLHSGCPRSKTVTHKKRGALCHYVSGFKVCFRAASVNRRTKNPPTRHVPLTLNAPATQHEMKLIKRLPALTPREVEIVRLIRKGYSNKEIAQELGIAVTTVKWNMTNILAKFEVQSSKQLIALLATQAADDSREWTILE